MASRRSSIYKQDKIILVENDRVLTEPSCVAEVSNDYFANIAETGDNTDWLADFSDHSSVKSITERKFLDNFSFNPVNSSCIRDISDRLNPRKAVGVDGIRQSASFETVCSRSNKLRS